MNYRELESYFRGSRLLGACWALALVLTSIAVTVAIAAYRDTGLSPKLFVIYMLILVAQAVTLYYAPDYLALTANRDKAKKWAVKVRWRIIGGLLVVGLLASATAEGRMATLVAAVGLMISNLLVSRLSRDFAPVVYVLTDALLVFGANVFAHLDGVVLYILFAAIMQFSVLVAPDEGWGRWWFLIVAFLAVVGGPITGQGATVIFPALVAVSGTEFMRRRAAARRNRDRASALHELVSYSGKSLSEVEGLWSESNRLLAENWTAAKLNEDDHAAVKEWYRQNSGLYLYAISEHNLEYKKILSNLRMLRLAKGSCLDYGAGNGEIVLELAARGHGAIYFDVDGETLRFARWRAQQRSLVIAFATSKEELRPGLDTIFSFDVLEHVPDLPGELKFLSSLLSKGGTLMCDVPAGATKNHPMHLNHRLEVAKYLHELGLRDRRTPLQRLLMPEKYVFQSTG